MGLSKILFRRNNTENRVPKVSEISEGEITVNTNEERPFISIGGKDSSGGTSVNNIYRDRFFLEVDRNGKNDTYSLTEQSLILVKSFKITLSKDTLRNGVYLKFHDGRIFSFSHINDAEPSIVFANLSVIGGKITYATLTCDKSDTFVEDYTFSLEESVIEPLDLGEYESDLDEGEEGIITNTMTLSDALKQLEKTITDMSKAINDLNNRLTALENA